jgi:hypothetical protein
VDQYLSLCRARARAPEEKTGFVAAAMHRAAFRRERDYYCAGNDNAVSQSRLLIT